VKQTRGHIDTDPVGRTNVAGLWAIGDVAGPPLVAPQGDARGGDHRRGDRRRQSASARQEQYPGCTYSRPQVASVGYSEAKAKEVGYKVRVGKVPVHRQRQGDCARRGGRLHQDHLRRGHGGAIGGAHDRGRSDRADPRLCRRPHARDHRAGADGDDLPRTRRCRRCCTRACSAPTDARCTFKDWGPLRGGERGRPCASPLGSK
jgi:hypothetical protein